MRTLLISVVLGCFAAACTSPGVQLAPPDDDDMAGSSMTPGIDLGGAVTPTVPPPDVPGDDMSNDPPVEGDMGSGDEDMGVDMEQPPDELPNHPEVYSAQDLVTPVTPYIATQLRQVLASGSGRADVFAKVGASNTVNRNFMHCFAGDRVDLDGRDHLQPTIDFFAGGDAAGSNPYQRESLAARVGMSASWPLRGNPKPLDQELAAISPSIALVHYGTNDIQLRNIHAYGVNLLNLVDTLLERGVIPVMTTVPPRDDNADADLWVPRYNAMMRAVAQTRQTPLIDSGAHQRTLPDHGLGPDGIHLNALGAGRACVFTEEGLRYGFNARNLMTIELLQKLHQVVVEGEDVFDVPAPPQPGSGTAQDPYLIDTLPFAHSASTSQSSEDAIDRYPGCNASQNESGPEVHYELRLDAPTTLRIDLVDRDPVDIDIHLLGESADPATSCLERDHETITRELQPGTYRIVLDTFVSSGGAERDGEYIVVMMAD